MTTTPLQMLVMNKARHAPTLASASNHSAFNLANAGGAWLGGLSISAGWGWTSPALVGAVLAAAGLGIAVTAGVLDRRAPRTTSAVVAEGGPQLLGAHLEPVPGHGLGAGELAAADTV